MTLMASIGLVYALVGLLLYGVAWVADRSRGWLRPTWSHQFLVLLVILVAWPYLVREFVRSERRGSGLGRG